jgi:RHS repeat-associated protein
MQMHNTCININGIMAIYHTTDNDRLRLIERPVYGGSRLGIVKQNMTFLNSGILFKRDTFSVGLKNYELTDHLGNVTVTFLDRKYGNLPDTTSLSDYYPFGFPMPDRGENLAMYRFGFNGQESDNEVYGDKESYAFEFRNYDARLGRWWGIDPLWQKYPSLSPYAYCANNPIIYIDPNGREKIPALNPGTTPNYATARKGIRNYTRNIGVIHLWGHGNKKTIEAYNEKTKEVKFLTSPKNLEAFLIENSAVYRNNNQEGKESKTSILVLHSCSTGESGGIAQQASTKDLNLLVVAPTDILTMSTQTDGTNVTKVTEDVNNGGGWAVYYKGEKMETFKGSTKPLFDNPDKTIEKYEKMYQEKYANPEN